MPMRKIIHIDMDAFYASVEQRDDPTLQGRPVAVGHGAKRGVVAAASYEARAFGVRSAMPSTTAMRQCAELVFVQPRFESIEPFRADPCNFCGLHRADRAAGARRGLSRCHGKPARAADSVGDRQGNSARILEETKLTASAGVSYNKFLAKLASGERKPNGQFVIAPGAGADFVASLPVAKFHGVGHVTAAKMQRLGIQTGADLRAQSLAFLQQHFGRSAAWYLGIAKGEDDRPVVADRPRKSSGSETTFEHDLTATAEIESGVEAMADNVWAWCDKTKVFARTVTVKVKFADFHQVTRSRSFSGAIVSRDLLRRASVELVRMLLPTNKGVRLLGVTVSNFDNALADPIVGCHFLAAAERRCRTA